MTFPRPALLLIALLSPALAVAAEDKWEITTSFEMVGMPFAMPPQKQTVCAPAGQPVNEKMVPAKSNCKVSGFTTSGSTSRFHIECPPPEQMSGDGEFTSLGANGYKGRMSVRANMEGEKMDMKMSFEGKRIGACAAGDAAVGGAVSRQRVDQLMQQQQSQANAMCEQMYGGFAYQAEMSMGAVCPNYRQNLCARARTKFESAAANPDEMVVLQEERRDWREIGNYCGLDASAYARTACAGAKKAQNWNNAVLLCGDDPELAASAKAQCTGMKFTGNPRAAALRPLCEKFGAKAAQPKTPAPAQVPNSPVPAGNRDGDEDSDSVEAAAAMDAGNKAMDTLKQFKGLFGR